MYRAFIPIDSVKKSFLMDIPPSTYSNSVTKMLRPRAGGIAKLFSTAHDEAISDISYSGLSAVTLNIGGWVCLPIQIRRPVSLLTVYADNAGEHGVLVEEIEARGASQVLLSGVVDIKAAGPIRSIKLYCGGIDDDRVSFQHVHVQKIKSQREQVSLQACSRSVGK